jgi:hypothetical protein
MCFVQLYRFMSLYFLTRHLQEVGVDQSEILFLTRDKIKISERIILLDNKPFDIDDTSAYCLWLLTNSLNSSQRHLFINKLA